MRGSLAVSFGIDVLHLLEKVLEQYARAVYHEFGVHDEQGRLIGHEWYGVRSSQIHFTGVDTSSQRHRGKDNRRT